MDRVDVKQYVPHPSAKASYEILRSCYLELIKCGIITPIEESKDNSALPDARKQSQWPIDETEALPKYSEMLLSYWMDTTSAPKRLWDIAVRSAVSSGPKL